MSVGGAQKKRR